MVPRAPLLPLCAHKLARRARPWTLCVHLTQTGPWTQKPLNVKRKPAPLGPRGTPETCGHLGTKRKQWLHSGRSQPLPQCLLSPGEPPQEEAGLAASSPLTHGDLGRGSFGTMGCVAFLLLRATRVQPLLGLTSEGLTGPEAKEGSGSLWESESPGGGWLTPAAQTWETPAAAPGPPSHCTLRASAPRQGQKGQRRPPTR